MVGSNTYRSNSSNYNIKNISRHNIKSNQTNINKSYMNQTITNNLIKFDFKTTNNELKNFSLYENFIKNDILNKHTNKNH